MRIICHAYTNFGILKHHIVKHCPIGHLDVFKGETNKSYIQIFKEYVGGKLDLKYYYVVDKTTGKTKSRLRHINNMKITREFNCGQ